MKIYFGLIILFIFLSCSESSPEDDYNLFNDSLYTKKIEFKGDGIIIYTKTGPEWEDANIEVGSDLFVMGEGKIENETGLLIPDVCDMPVYVSGSIPELTFYPAYRHTAEPLPEITYSYKGIFIKESGAQIELFNISGALKANSENEYPSVLLSLPQLSHESSNLYTLHITHEYSALGEEWIQDTEQEFAQTWRLPIDGVPLYKKIIRWGCLWLNATFEEKGEETENVIADIYIDAMRSLEDEGYSYGAFPRPSQEEYTNTAEVFLDFKRSACGEFRGFFLALLESQGIDANWLLFNYYEPSSENYSMYQTIEIAALGRSKRVWRYSNHIMTEVNGVVYDPVYLVRKSSMEEYEDFMFASYCYGEDYTCANDWCTEADGPQNICIDNPAGYQEGISPPVFRGDSY